jgi:hypothetical protein
VIWAALTTVKRDRKKVEIIYTVVNRWDCLCGLVVGVPGYRSRGPGLIPGATRFSEKYWVWNGDHSAS